MDQKKEDSLPVSEHTEADKIEAEKKKPLSIRWRTRVTAGKAALQMPFY